MYKVGFIHPIITYFQILWIHLGSSSLSYVVCEVCQVNECNPCSIKEKLIYPGIQTYPGLSFYLFLFYFFLLPAQTRKLDALAFFSFHNILSCTRWRVREYQNISTTQGPNSLFHSSPICDLVRGCNCKDMKNVTQRESQEQGADICKSRERCSMFYTVVLMMIIIIFLVI